MPMNGKCPIPPLHLTNLEDDFTLYYVVGHTINNCKHYPDGSVIRTHYTNTLITYFIYLFKTSLHTIKGTMILKYIKQFTSYERQGGALIGVISLDIGMTMHIYINTHMHMHLYTHIQPHIHIHIYVHA